MESPAETQTRSDITVILTNQGATGLCKARRRAANPVLAVGNHPSPANGKVEITRADLEKHASAAMGASRAFF